jgi:predicted nucleic acid-binding protein
MNKILVDTNILIYAIDQDSIFHTKSQQLVQNTQHELYTTSKNLSEFLVVLTRGMNISVHVTEALDILESLLSYFTILYPTEASVTEFKNLIRKYNPKGLKIHDFEIISIGLQNDVKIFATKNIDDFKGIKEIRLISI